MKKEYKVLRRFLPYYSNKQEDINEYKVIKKFASVKEANSFWKQYKKENGDFFGLKGYEGYYLVNEDNLMLKVFRTFRPKYKPV